MSIITSKELNSKGTVALQRILSQKTNMIFSFIFKLPLINACNNFIFNEPVSVLLLTLHIFPNVNVNTNSSLHRRSKHQLQHFLNTYDHFCE